MLKISMAKILLMFYMIRDVEIGELINTMHCECIIRGFDSLISTQTYALMDKQEQSHHPFKVEFYGFKSR